MKEVKIHSWTIKPETIKRMFEILRDSNFHQIEEGARLCLDREKREITIGKECIGNECSLTFPKPDCVNAGTYHTHQLSKNIKLSIDDIIAHFTFLSYISCIGADSKIECFEQKSDSDDYWRQILTDLPKLKEEQIIFENSKKEYKDILRVTKAADVFEKKYLKHIKLPRPRGVIK